MYNGIGEIINWIVVTDGSVLSDDFVLQNSNDVLLLKTHDGGLSSTTLRSALVVLQR